MRKLSPEEQTKFDAFCNKHECEASARVYDVFAKEERKKATIIKGKAQFREAIQTLHAELGTYDIKRIFGEIINEY